MNSRNYAGNLAASTARGPSPVLWGNCPINDFDENPGDGMMLLDDFIGAPNIPSASGGAIAQGYDNNFSIYAYQGATLTDGALEGGVITFGSDGDNEGVAFGPSAGAFRMLTTSTLALNGKLWFEARWARSDVTTAKGDFFVGLFDGFLTSGIPTAAIPITTTNDTLASSVNFIGFHSNATTATRGGPTEIAFTFNLAGGTIQYPTNLTTLMASSGNSVLTSGGFVKTGFLFDPFAAPKMVTKATARQTVGQVKRALIRIFINGLELPTFLTADDVVNATSGQAFPTGFMGPGFAVMNNTGSSPPTMSMDWIRCAQIANS